MNLHTRLSQPFEDKGEKCKVVYGKNGLHISNTKDSSLTFTPSSPSHSIVELCAAVTHLKGSLKHAVVVILTSLSISSSNEISSSVSSFFLSFFSTKPGGRACRYIQLSPPAGHTQNQPYLLFSMASKKYLHTCRQTIVS